MQIRFACEDCGYQLTVPEKLSGKRGKCPNCGATVQVPLAGEPSDPAPEARPPETKPPGPLPGKIRKGPPRPPLGKKKAGFGRRPLAARGRRTEKDPPEGESAGEYGPETIRQLSETRPWVLFLSILGFVGVGAAALVGVVTFVAGMIGGIGAGGLLLILLLYGAGPAIGFFLAWYLFKYARGIKSFVVEPSTLHLDGALRAQKSYWKLTGVLALVGLAISALMLLAMVAGLLTFKKTAEEQFFRDMKKFQNFPTGKNF